MKKFDLFIEVFFALIALIVARIMANCFFNGSFWAFLLGYIVMVLLAMPMENIVKKKLKNSLCGRKKK